MLQGKIHTTSGFTLVEVMIAIVIIVLLSQTGNLMSLFQSQEKTELEWISVAVLAAIDEQKTHTLLGKTEEKKIVRKRKISLIMDDVSLTYRTGINLAQDAESAGFTETSSYAKNLNGNGWTLSVCPGIINPLLGSPLEDANQVDIIFEDDTIAFQKWDGTDILQPHLVLTIGSNKSNREIHIDRRTGLTYERSWVNPLDAPSCQ